MVYLYVARPISVIHTLRCATQCVIHRDGSRTVWVGHTMFEVSLCIRELEVIAATMMQRGLATKLLSRAVAATMGQAARPSFAAEAALCRTAAPPNPSHALRSLGSVADSSDSAPNGFAAIAGAAALAGAVGLTIDAAQSEAAPDKKQEKVIAFCSGILVQVMIRD